MRLTVQQAYGYARAAGFSAATAPMVVAIGMAESGLNTDAVGDTALANSTWGPSVGWLQIRSLRSQRGTGGERDELRLRDPAFCARAAYGIAHGGTDFRPWSVYTAGKAQAGLPAVMAAIAGAASGGLELAASFVANARRALGTPYQWGGETLGVGMDCSGFIQWAAAQVGIKLPRTAAEQALSGTPVSAAQARAGDLVYKPGPSGSTGHGGIYLGGGQWIEAPRTGDRVKIAPVDLNSATTIRRITPGGDAAGAPAPVGGFSAAPALYGADGKLTLAGYSQVVDLTPGGMPLNPLKLPGWLAGRAGDAVSGGVAATLSAAGPLALTVVAVTAAAALVVLGVYKGLDSSGAGGNAAAAAAAKAAA